MAVSSLQTGQVRALMGTTAVIGFGILAWALVAILLSLGAGRVIKLRDRQSPKSVEPETPVPDDSSSGAVRSPPTQP
jgi:hypothetical protein